MDTTSRIGGSSSLHENVRKYGTAFNTVAPATDLEGVLIRTT